MRWLFGTLLGGLLLLFNPVNDSKIYWNTKLQKARNAQKLSHEYSIRLFKSGAETCRWCRWGVQSVDIPTRSVWIGRDTQRRRIGSEVGVILKPATLWLVGGMKVELYSSDCEVLERRLAAVAVSAMSPRLQPVWRWTDERRWGLEMLRRDWDSGRVIRELWSVGVIRGVMDG